VGVAGTGGEGISLIGIHEIGHPLPRIHDAVPILVDHHGDPIVRGDLDRHRGGLVDPVTGTTQIGHDRVHGRPGVLLRLGQMTSLGLGPRAFVQDQDGASRDHGEQAQGNRDFDQSVAPVVSPKVGGTA